MHFTLCARVDSARQAAVELRRLGLDVDVHPRMPRDRTTLFSVFDVAPEQRHLVRQIVRSHDAEIFTDGLG